MPSQVDTSEDFVLSGQANSQNEVTIHERSVFVIPIMRADR